MLWLPVILVLGILILAHEWGHFLAARWTKTRVEEFGLGYPPRLLTLGERNGVVYSLNWIPAGGFVRLAGEKDPNLPGGLAGQPPGRRALVLLAGSLMNLLLAFLIFTGVSLFPHAEVTLDRIGVLGIIPGSPADQAGLQGGDIILAVEGRPVQDQEVILELRLHGGREATLTVERQGQVMTMTVVPSVRPIQGLDHLGVTRYLHEYPLAELKQVLPGRPAYQAGLRPGDVVLSLNGEAVRNNLDFWEKQHRLRQEHHPIVFVVRREGQVLPPITVYPPPPEAEDQTLGYGWWPPTVTVHPSLGEALQQGGRDTLDSVLLVVRLLSALGHGSVPLQSLAGPLGIAQATVEVAQANQIVGVLRLIGMLSANLFVVNLLPLPALDGGRLAFVLLEWLRGGRRIPPHWETLVHTVGMALLLGLLALVTWFDLLRLLGL